MANNPTSYFQIIRKMNIAFAGLFKNIIIVRSDPELNAVKTEDQRFIVPIEYADKEKYTKRLIGDPDLQRKTQITLPRLSYEFIGMSYDSSRKLNTNNKNFAPDLTSSNSILAQYNPVPYDFNFQLTAYTRTIEDGSQIIEQILPYFTPDFTIKVNLIPEMGIVKNLPILLNEVIPSIESDGMYDSEVRVVMFTFSFTIKGFIFGAIKNQKVITSSDVNLNVGTYSISSNDFGHCDTDITRTYTMLDSENGEYRLGEIVYQGFNLENSIGTGVVKSWNKDKKELVISNISGCFKVGQTVVGTISLASYMINSDNTSSTTMIRFHAEPDPKTANANSNWIANTTIYYYPNIPQL